MLYTIYMELYEKSCVPNEGSDARPVLIDEAQTLLPQIPGWSIDSYSGKLIKEYTFNYFSEVMIFVQKIFQLAETEGHHPDIRIAFTKVRLELTTRAVCGLSENDFILASKINKLQ